MIYLVTGKEHIVRYCAAGFNIISPSQARVREEWDHNVSSGIREACQYLQATTRATTRSLGGNRDMHENDVSARVGQVFSEYGIGLVCQQCQARSHGDLSHSSTSSSKAV